MKSILPTPFLAISTLLVLMATASSAFSQGRQTLPVGFDTVDANSATSHPFNSFADQKWQWHYDSGQFQMAHPILITEVYVRANTSTESISFDFPSVQILMSSSPTDYTKDDHDIVFSNNLNSDAKVVRAAAPFTGTDVPPATWIPFGLDRPFLYDPTTGEDFILQIRKCSSASTWGVNIDGVSGSVGANGGNRYGDILSCNASEYSTSNNEFVPLVMIDWMPDAPVMEVDPMVAGDLTDFHFSQVDPGGMIYIRWSLNGSGPTVTSLGDLLLTPPIEIVPVVHADIEGNLVFSTYIPMSLLGETFYIHSVAQRNGEFQFTNALQLLVQ